MVDWLRCEYRTHAPEMLKLMRQLTLVAETHAPDEDFAALKAHYSDAQITELTFAIAHMNALNRIAVGAAQAAPA